MNFESERLSELRNETSEKNVFQESMFNYRPMLNKLIRERVREFEHVREHFEGLSMPSELT